MVEVQDPVGMEEQQHLTSDAINRINSELQNITNIYPKVFTDGIQLVPCSYDIQHQCFRWLSVHNNNWKWNAALLQGCNNALQSLFDEWDKESQILGDGWFERLPPDENGLWDFGPLKARWEEITSQLDFHNFDVDGSCHRALLDLVAGRAIRCDQYIEGLVFEQVKQFAQNNFTPVDFIISELLHSYKDTEFPPAKFVVYPYKRRKSEPKYYSQSDGRVCDSAHELACHIAVLKKNETSGKWATKLQYAMMKLTETDKLQCFISVPIYDGGSSRDPWGRLVGIIHAMIYQDITEAKCKKIAKLITSHAGRLAEAFRSIARAKAAAAPITREDGSAVSTTVHHFLRLLPMFQDWECAAVSRDQEDEIECWTRNGNNWGKCKAPGECSSCPVRDQLKNPSSTCKKNIMVMKEDLSSLIQLPWSNKDDLQEIAKLRFAFELPKYAVLPDTSTGLGKSNFDRLARQYFHEQIDILRLLIPKVQRHRYAVQTTAVAIMSRNMSHNIGSHVLARYSSEIRADAPVFPPSGKADHRGDFLAYLQRRMDFLAAMATSDQAFQSQPLSMKEQIGRLNYDEQQKRFDSGKNPVILSYITGKKTLKASVEFGAPEGWCPHSDDYFSIAQDDVWFTCPGGEVGAHALFVILENIIRNSARHGSAVGAGTVRIFVRVGEEISGSSNLLTLEIIDPRTKLEEDGRLSSNSWTQEEAKTEKEKLECTDGQHSLYKPDGTRRKLICLDKEINSILGSEPFLNADGKSNPHYWGVREMQICAHYLRGFPLSDLEKTVEYPVLKAGVHDLGGGSSCLKYTLYLQRAKLMAALVKEGRLDKDKDTLRRKGIQIIDPDSGWEKIAADAQGYSFLVVDDDIPIPDEGDHQRALLPVRTLNYSSNNIKAAHEDKNSGIAWMEPLHEHERCRYQKKRGAWKERNYWGLDARVNLVDETTTGLWRKVQLDTNLRDEHFLNRGMWPLADGHQEMVGELRNKEIAALWLDHPRPEFFIAPQGGLGGKIVLNQAAAPGNPVIRRWIHVEGIFHDSPHNAALDAAERGIYQELLTAAMPRVAVLDERVQSAAETDVRSIALELIWPSMGVWVPDRDSCNLDEPKMAELNGFLKKPTLHTEHYPIDFIILHLTILERLHKDSTDKSHTFAQTLRQLTNETEAARAEVVVVTGRGAPAVTRSDDRDYLPNVRYLPVSAILEYLVTRPSKLALMRALWSASRPSTAPERS